MLLIKYFSNTKAIGFEAQEPFSESPPHTDTHCRQWAWDRTASSGKMQHWDFVFSLFTSQDGLAICTGSWLDSGTCTYTRHKEVCAHSLGFFWSPRSAGPQETSSDIHPLPDRGSPGECWSRSDHHRGRPCCRRRARLSHPSHTSRRLRSGSFLCRAQQTAPSSGRGCSHVSSPSQASLWGVTLGYIYDSISWDEGGLECCRFYKTA